MMRTVSLHTVLGSIVAATLATGCGGSTEGSTGTAGAGGVATGGSGGATGGSGGATGGMGGVTPTTMVCEGEQPRLTDGLNTTKFVDYLALNRMEFDPDPVLLEESGSACVMSGDPTACLAEVGAARPDCRLEPPPANCSEWGIALTGGSPYYHYFVTTEGATVDDLSTVQAVKGFLGTIDTPNEAALILWMADRAVKCGDILQGQDGYYAEGRWMISDCPFTYQELRVRVSPDGTIDSWPLAEPEETGGCAGRRPDGLERGRHDRSAGTLARYFAEICHLEGAAVVAFVLLERELREHRAPEELVARAARAARDEVRHAAATGQLARRFGGELSPVSVKLHATRSLFHVALENAVEGCVRETYGALAAHWQARVASDEAARRAWSDIAREETEHAELSRDIDAWLQPQLSAEQRAQIARARRDAMTTLRRELSRPVDADVARVAGVPTPAQAHALLDGLEQTAWAA